MGMNIEFEGQVVVVTGATRGIGKQIAADFEELGARLILTGTDPAEVEALNSASGQGSKGRRTYHAVDFRDAGSLRAFTDELAGSERIDVLVNNAGINRLSPIDEALDEDLRDILAVNVEAPVLITRAVSGVMKRRGYGRIVNIGSIWGSIGKPGRAVYSVSKHAVHGLTVGSAVDLAPHNVLVNTVSPGFVMTDLTRANLSEQERADLAAQVPVGRFAEPSEISKAVLFLASAQNSYITGQELVVDGGFVHV